MARLAGQWSLDHSLSVSAMAVLAPTDAQAEQHEGWFRQAIEQAQHETSGLSGRDAADVASTERESTSHP